MQSWGIREWGLSHLSLSSAEIPKPGTEEVLVRFEAASLNYRDLMIVKGQYNPNFVKPLIPCSDGYGEIVAVGSSVEQSLLKRKVISTFCPQWLSGPPQPVALRETLGGPLPGVLQQYRLFRPHELILLKEPSALTPAEWATLPCAGVTAWNCLIAQARLTVGQTVLLIGTGGVSLFGLQLAKMVGARVLLLSSSDEKRERAKECGADEVADYREKKDWSTWVLEKTDGVGVDVVLETGGAGTLEQSIRSTKIGGYISLIGVLSGHQERLNIVPILMKAITVQGVLVGNHEHCTQLISGLLQTMTRPIVDRVFDWHQVPAAFDMLESGEQFGKITIRFPSED